MQDSARIAAIIEVLSVCESAWNNPRPLPADIIMNRYFKERRYIGSKDRGMIAETVYYIIRHYGTLRWWTHRFQQAGARALVITALLKRYNYDQAKLAAAFDGERFSPAPLSAAEIAYIKDIAGKALIDPAMPAHARYNYPEWLESNLHASLGDTWQQEIDSLNTEAPVDLRANTLLTTREDLIKALTKEGYAVKATPISPVGVRMQTRAPIFTSECFKRGWFEMQDEGSQIVSLLLDAKAGEKIIDFCAGAGGKTLALAASMNNKGRILAWDTSSKRLEQMIPRIKRARADNIQRHIIESENDAFIKRHKNSADGVFIDAPCSGSGTWRRNPDLKWRFRESDLLEILSIQKRILDSASRLVKPGGRLLYVTCSVLQSENERQIEAFLETHEKFRVVLMEKIWNNIFPQTMRQGSSLRLTPHKDGTDGFFASLIECCE